MNKCMKKMFSAMTAAAVCAVNMTVFPAYSGIIIDHNSSGVDKGFYYEVLKEGTGRKAEPGLIIDFDYKGTFTNGQIFDQTYGNRSSIVHLVDESLMPGLREGFCMMKAGSTYRFYFPCEMAFGAKGTDDIPPFTTVIYEVELHDVHE